MKQEIKNQMFWMLQDVITHFGSNPKNNRAVIMGDGKEGSCKYSRINGNLGCAIGMYLSDKVADKLDSLDSTSIDDIIDDNPECLPKWMLKLDKYFLCELQHLHDTSCNWDLNNNCISTKGVEIIKLMCKQYELPFEELTFPKNKKTTK